MGQIRDRGPWPEGTRVVATRMISYAGAGVHIEAGTVGRVVVNRMRPMAGIAEIRWEGQGRPFLTKLFNQVEAAS